MEGSLLKWTDNGDDGKMMQLTLDSAPDKRNSSDQMIGSYLERTTAMAYIILEECICKKMEDYTIKLGSLVRCKIGITNKCVSHKLSKDIYKKCNYFMFPARPE